MQTTQKLGTLEGVFVPTTMTILGVILFVRTGWVVGQTGLAGAVAVILLAFAVSTATALSISSIVTNVRVEAGGAFALLTRTLGIEPGGSIGVPLYLAQALAVPLYVFGFREGWRQIFPDHAALAVDTVVFAAILGIAAISARFAFRLQFVVLVVLAGAVISLTGGLATHELHTPTVWTSSDESFFGVFGVFFPAVTGIMAGVNMSGELASPRRSIIRGTMAAIGVTLLTYLLVAVCAALLVDPETLRRPEAVLAPYALWSPLLLAGLLCATFSSALSTIVGAPRILQAIAAAGVLPKGAWVAKAGWRGQPHRALLVTAIVAGTGIAMRDLNAIAPLITLFFLLTYAAINLTLFVQQALQLPRFRPSFRVPLVVPAIGTVGCLGGMIAVSPTFTVVALLCIVALYVLLVRRRPEGPFGQVRAGMVVTLLAWALGRLTEVPSDRAWLAHQLVPVRDAASVRGLAPLLGAVSRRGGSIAFLELGDVAGLEDAVADLRAEGVTITAGRASQEGNQDTVQALHTAMDVLGAALLPPNLLLLPLLELDSPWSQAETLPQLVRDARARGLGLWLASVPDSAPGAESQEDGAWPRVSVWVEAGALDPRRPAEGLSLVLLAAWRVHQAFGIPVRLTALSSPDASDEDAAQLDRDLERVVERARIPGLDSSRRACTMLDALRDADEALHLLVTRTPEHGPDRLREIREAARGQLVLACLSGDADAEDP